MNLNFTKSDSHLAQLQRVYKQFVPFPIHALLPKS